MTSSGRWLPLYQRDAIDSFIALAKSKTPRAASSTLAAQHTTHEKLGRAEALLRSARAFLYESVRGFSAAPVGERIQEWSAITRLAAAHAAQSAAEAVDIVFEAGGGTSIYTSSRLERCFRDVHVITHNIGVAPASNFEMVGQYLLGGPLKYRR